MTLETNKGQAQGARWLVAGVRLAFFLAVMLVIVALAGNAVLRYLARTRGIESGLGTRQPTLVQPRFGVNVSLERYTDEATLRAALVQLHDTGFRTIRQRFPWSQIEPAPGEYHWETWDLMVAAARENDLRIIAVLDTSPAWARGPADAENEWAPPARMTDYARFVEAFAQHYHGQMLAYQIWDEPNTAPHWGQGEIDPAGYVEMLHLASTFARRQDPQALIIAGGLAPNVESGGRNMSDVGFLHEIYRRGAAKDFDILGVKPYGFWSGPDDRRVKESVLNFSRVILLRREMVRRGDAAKPIWGVEAGWCALPQDWRGRPSPTGSDVALVQEERLDRALDRVQEEWPWMGFMAVAQFQPNADAEDPIWGYALLGPDGEPRPELERLRKRLQAWQVFYPGVTESPRGYLKPAGGDELTALAFWGTDLVLEIQHRETPEKLIVYVDNRPKSVTVDPSSALQGLARVRVAKGLAGGLHSVNVQGAPEALKTLRGVQVGNRPKQDEIGMVLLVGLLGLGWCGLRGWQAGRRIPWRWWWGSISRGWRTRPLWLQAGVLVIGGLATALAPSAYLRLLGALLYGVGALLRPDLALMGAIAVVPLAPLHVRLGPGSFSLTEIGILVAAVARLGEVLLAEPPERGKAPRVSWLRRWKLLDWAVLALVILGLGTSFVAEYQKEAFRELRVVVGEAALLYLLIRSGRAEERNLLHLADVLWLGAVAVALYALAAYPTAKGVIEAEGVRRARAFYGSPNNLALYLERMLPVGLAVGLWGRNTWRRWAYGLGALPVVAALGLTFSRGALLLGVPALVLALGWLRGGKVRWVMVGLALVGGLALIPLARTPRFSSLLDPTQGTTFIRVSLWQASWRMVRAHPWLGVGLDNFLYYYGDYILPGAEVERWLSHPHNLVLDFWLRLGIGGVVLIGVMLAEFARRGIGAYRRLAEGDRRAVTLGLLAGMAACVAHGMIDTSFFVAELAYWFMFALAWVALCEPRNAAVATTNGPASREML